MSFVILSSLVSRRNLGLVIITVFTQIKLEGLAGISVFMTFIIKFLLTSGFYGALCLGHGCLPHTESPVRAEGAPFSQGHGCTHWVISQHCAASSSDNLSVIIPPGPVQLLRSQFPLFVSSSRTCQRPGIQFSLESDGICTSSNPAKSLLGYYFSLL